MIGGGFYMAEERVTERRFTLRCRWREYRDWLERTRKHCRWSGGGLVFELDGCLCLSLVGGDGPPWELDIYADVRVTPAPANGVVAITAVMTEYGDPGDFDSQFDDFVTESILQFDGHEGHGTQPTPAGRGPTIKTQERFQLFETIKREHPNWGYATVAAEANKRANVEAFTENTVRNTYRQMGVVWERADRIR